MPYAYQALIITKQAEQTDEKMLVMPLYTDNNTREHSIPPKTLHKISNHALLFTVLKDAKLTLHNACRPTTSTITHSQLVTYFTTHSLLA
jgi:hypothetical protein